MATHRARASNASRFDRAYYPRFYFNTRTAVVSASEVRARGTLIAAFVEHVGLPVRRILDAGCGTGRLKSVLLRRLRRARYTGLELSEYLCRRYGWEHGTIEEFRSTTAFDLVVCYDVLQYLDGRAADRALANLTRLTRGVLYFGALTREDWLTNCDQRRTDPDVHQRSGAWYRRRLRRGFHEIGAGFWMRRGAPLAIWELERAGRR